jgi:23S rRNA pseudouridine1911/1915/1917 synthase
MATTHRFVVGADDAGLRLDQVLPRHVPGLSRRKARVLVDVGGVFVDRARVKIASRPVRAGQAIEVHLGGVIDRASGEVGAAARARDAAELPAYAIVYEDDDLVVVDKPAGLVTAPTPESDRGNLADLLARRPGGSPVHVVHRLDRPTSGVLVLAKTEAASRALAAAFAAHAIEREYRAVALGVIAEPLTIAREVGGKAAVTHVTPLERLAGATLLACRLETGRTHQIRIHLAAIGHPVLGDHQHGGPAVRSFTPRPPRLALHAMVLGFTHPRTGAALRFERPLPPDLATWLASLHGDAVP